MMETVPVVNFCIAVSLLYLFYIPPSSGYSSREVCTLFSSLFHLSFLIAAFSCFSLVLLRPLRNYRKAKVVYAVTIVLNWGESIFAECSLCFSSLCIPVLPVLCLVVTLAPNITNYTMTDIV